MLLLLEIVRYVHVQKPRDPAKFRFPRHADA